MSTPQPAPRKRQVRTADLHRFLQNVLQSVDITDDPVSDGYHTWGDDILCQVDVATFKSIKGYGIHVTAKDGDYGNGGRWTVLVTPADVRSM